MLCCSTDTTILMAPRPPPPLPPPPLLAISSCCSRLLSTLFSFAASNPLPLAYFLYFSPYIAKAAAFLFPLLLTTAILVLLVAATVPSLLLLPHSTEELHDDASSSVTPATGIPGSPLPGMLITGDETEERDGVAYSGLIGIIWSELQGCVDVASQSYGSYEEEENSVADEEEDQQEKEGTKELGLSSEEEIQAKAGGEKRGTEMDAPSPPSQPTLDGTARAPVITWREFEAIGKLYKALTQEIDASPPIKLAAITCPDKTGLLPQYSDRALPAKDARHPVLSRCHSRGSPLEGWESTPGSELDDDEEFFSATSQRMLLPWRRPEEKDGPRSLGHAAALGRFGGSMREGQWRRETVLASCKSMSVHERQWARSMSVAGVKEEGMDMLWEEYDDTAKAATSEAVGGTNKFGDGKDGKSKKEKKAKMRRCRSKVDYREEEYAEEEQDDFLEDDDDEAELGGGKLCCLQALRFSTGRMRFGMGKLGTGLAKATKALKGATLGPFRHGSSSGTVRRAGVEKGY